MYIRTQSLSLSLPNTSYTSTLKHSTARSHPMADVTTQINHLDAQKKILIALPNVSLADVVTGERGSSCANFGGMYTENSGGSRLHQSLHHADRMYAMVPNLHCHYRLLNFLFESLRNPWN